MSNLIRWGSNDRKNLQRAVNNFNAKINRLEKQGIKELPSKVSYKELRGWGSNDNEILTRKELNQTIRTLQAFTKRGMEKLVTLAGGEKITKWENREIGKMQRRARSTINKDIEKLEEAKLFGMGDKELQQKLGQLKSIMKLRNKSGYLFKKGLEALKNISSPSRSMKNAKMWKNNYMTALDDMKGRFDNVELLQNALLSMKNPEKAFEFIQQSDELNDVFKWYPEKASVQSYGSFANNQEAFDNGLRKLGLLE